MSAFFLYYENKKHVLDPGCRYVLGRGDHCDIVLSGETVSRRHASIESSDGFFTVKDLGSTNGTWYQGEKISVAVLRNGDTFRIADFNLSIRETGSHEKLRPGQSGDTMIFEKKVSEILDRTDDSELRQDIAVLKNLYNRKKEHLAFLAYRDELTGLYNRRYFDLRLAEEVSRSQRYSHPLSLVMIDIDRFKKINDSYGHQKGDDVLATVAAILKRSVRKLDFVFRYGGEEMALVLPETTAEAAVNVSETCRRNIEFFSEKESGVSVTASFGVAEISGKTETPEKLISRSDEALYEAKQSGRNRTVSAV